MGLKLNNIIYKNNFSGGLCNGNKQRLIGELIELIQIDSLSSKEGNIAKILVDKLKQLGLDVYVDDAGVKAGGGETGNVIIYTSRGY